MKALRLISHGSPGILKFQDLPDPIPGPTDVVVRVHACGLNHLDLWLEEKGLPIPLQLPRTPGCEAAGVVESVGADVTTWRRGDRVCLPSGIACGECEACLAGQESLCAGAEMFGIQRDGGFAELACVPARHPVRIPEGIDFEAAAAVTLAGSTAMHMLTDRATVHPGNWVLVVGAASGVGSHAIQIARALGARVITLASSARKRELGLSLGAEAALDPGDESWPREVRRLTSKRGVDVVVEHVGGATLLKCLECLARGGTVVTCGATSGREVPINLWPFFVKQQRLVGSYGRNRIDLVRTLDWVAAGTIRPVIDSVIPFDRAVEAFLRLRRREVLGKLVIRIP